MLRELVGRGGSRRAVDRAVVRLKRLEVLWAFRKRWIGVAEVGETKVACHDMLA
jgi:hypothetical protein